MIGFKIDQAKGLFFDRQKVIDATTRAERKVLSKFGAFVRTRARTSVRRRRAISEPGAPPSSHVGLLRQHIYFVYEPQAHNVIIGAARLNGPIGNAPEALEHGGDSEAAFFSKGKRQTRRIKVRPRPFMQPAFEAELPKLDSMWRDSVR